MYPLDMLNTSLLISGIEVGVHYYWDIAGVSIHGEVVLISSLVFFLLLGASFLGTSNLNQVPKGWQNFMELVLDFTQDIAKNQPNFKDATNESKAKEKDLVIFDYTATVGTRYLRDQISLGNHDYVQN